MIEVDRGAAASAMDEALRLARDTARLGNVPVGALVIADGEIIARAANLRQTLQDPTAHAELLALKAAAQRLGRWRLPDVTLVVTLEPCAMCAGAIAEARVGTLIYGAAEAKTGAVESRHRLLDQGATAVVRLDEHGDACVDVLRRFFEALRDRDGGSDDGEMAELVEGA